jgi:hypothetical protein
MACYGDSFTFTFTRTEGLCVRACYTQVVCELMEKILDFLPCKFPPNVRKVSASHGGNVARDTHNAYGVEARKIQTRLLDF